MDGVSLRSMRVVDSIYTSGELVFCMQVAANELSEGVESTRQVRNLQSKRMPVVYTNVSV